MQRYAMIRAAIHVNAKKAASTAETKTADLLRP